MGTDKYTDNIKKILETGEIPEKQEDEVMQMLKALLVMAEKELEAETEEGI